jgi:hypothetical protein
MRFGGVRLRGVWRSRGAGDDDSGLRAATDVNCGEKKTAFEKQGRLEINGVTGSK